MKQRKSKSRKTSFKNAHYNRSEMKASINQDLKKIDVTKEAVK